MLSQQEMIAIKESTFCAPANFGTIRKALKEEGIVIDSMKVRMLCYKLVEKGCLSFGEKTNRFVVTQEGRAKAGILENVEKSSIDKLAEALNKTSSFEQVVMRYKRSLLPLKKEAKQRETEIPGVLGLVKDIIEDITTEAAMQALLK